MIVKLNTCKGDKIEYYSTFNIDRFEINNRHISLYKDGIQIGHFPARYFTVEVIG
jgi:hypothetical protein